MEARVVGGLLGVAVGDALGVPVEGVSRKRLKARPVTDFLPASRWGLPPGTWSDDTSLTMCLAASLVERGELDLEDVGRRFVAWLDQGYWSPYGKPIGIGRTTRQAIGRLRRGVSAEAAGSKGEWSNGNGSLMRILPVALFHREVPDEELLSAAHRASAITHAHPRAQMGCGIYCLVARELLRGLEAKPAIRNAVSVARRAYNEEPYSSELEHYGRIWSLKIFEVGESEIRSSGYVVDTLEASLWCLVQSQDFRNAVLSAVNLGGDTDTVGAVTGGLAGVLYGERSIPEPWVRHLARADEIRRLGWQLCQTSTAATA